MRNLDNYGQIFDNDKNFLHGKLVFCQKGTTTQEQVYSWDSEHNAYVAVNPIVYTDINGRPSVQIYLADKDYTIYVYKYIGNGDMSLDSDDSNWVFQYSFNNLYEVFDLEINADSIVSIDRMETLKDTDPASVPSIDGKRIVALCGYQTLGDCPIVYYRWSEVSTESANDVDVVAVSGITTGRWLLVNTFEETGIFDVRHAGCFPKADEDMVDVTQSYALGKADTYAQKFGLTLFVPNPYESGNAFYIGTNISIYSPIWFDDGAVIVTGSSIAMNDLSEKNVGRSYPFMLHSDSHNGSISCAGNVICSSWFSNTETANPSVNYPPSINVRKKFVYDATFGVQGSNPTFTFEGLEIEILALLENESLDLTNCIITSDEYIKRGCSFTNCEIKGSFFNSGAMFSGNSFSGCRSDIDTWSDTDWYVTYCEKNGNTAIDLKHRTCTLDWESSATFPFTMIRNAVFSSNIKIPSGTILNISDSEIDTIVIDADNSTIEKVRIRNSMVNFRNKNNYKLSDCVLDAKDSRIHSDFGKAPIFKGADVDGCDIIGEFGVYDSAVKLSVTRCNVEQDITAECTASFVITFNENTISNYAELVMKSSNSSIKVNESSFCNNVVEETNKREFVNFSGVAGFDTDNIGSYVYENNYGVVKGCSGITKFFRVKYKKYGGSSTGDYVLQNAPNSSSCKLEGDGFKLNSLLFSFGEKTKRKTLAKLVCRYNSGMVYYHESGNLDSGYGDMDSIVCVYEEGIAADTRIMHGDFGSGGDLVSVPTYITDNSDVYFTLDVKRIEG